MQYLGFELSEGEAGITTLEALASTGAEHHAAVMEEAQAVLAWAWRHFPDTHGPVEEGHDWDHDLQVVVEDGRWHAVSLTFTGTPRFVDELLAAFGEGLGGDNDAA